MRRTVATLALLAAACAPHITPDPGHFALTPMILSKKCFGSSGCVISYQIEPTYNGPPLASSQRLTVTYEIDGGKDVQIGSFDVRGDEWRASRRHVIRTVSASSVLTARVIRVS